MVGEAKEIMEELQTMPGMKEMMSNMRMNPGEMFDFKIFQIRCSKI